MSKREQDKENRTIGGVTWHVSDEDSGPDVGISIYIGEQDRLYCGEMPDRTLIEHGLEPGGGWYIVRYGPKNDTRILAKVVNEEHPGDAQDFMEQIASWIRAGVK